MQKQQKKWHASANREDRPDVLAEANRERADAFFRRLVADGKVDAYLAAIAKRATLGTVQAIADRIRTLDAGNAPRPEQRARSQP